MNAIAKVNKFISIPMLAICAAAGVADFQKGDIWWGVTMALCCAWWSYMIYEHFISKK